MANPSVTSGGGRIKKVSRKKAKVGLPPSKLRQPIPESRAAVREWPKLEIFTEGQLAKSRKAVANLYGKTFASKASDPLCQALATVQAFALEAVAPRPRPTILEFSTKEVDHAEVRKIVVALAGSVGAVPAALLRIAQRRA